MNEDTNISNIYIAICDEEKAVEKSQKEVRQTADRLSKKNLEHIKLIKDLWILKEYNYEAHHVWFDGFHWPVEFYSFCISNSRLKKKFIVVC